MKTMCKHELKNYVGFTDTYQYCHLCGLKESEVVAEAYKTVFEIPATRPLINHITPIANQLQKRIGYTELKPINKGFEAWIPDNKPEGLNSGMALAILDRDERFTNNITKNEFFQAFEKVRNKKQWRGIDSKMFEEIWTEIEADWNGEPEDA